MLRKNYIIAVVVAVSVVVAMLFGPFLAVYIYSTTNGQQDISNTVRELVSDESDTITILNKFADWIMENLTYDTSPVYYYPAPPFLLCRQYRPNPAWIMTIRRGGCEEHATLFGKMARSVGIQSRVVYNTAEDHVWTEVLINGSWFHFDPMLSIEQRYNNAGIYERPRNEGGWEKELSYVFYVDQNNADQDVTSRYTDTGRLTVLVERDSKPVENAKIIIKSRYLMENILGYHRPLFCVAQDTNSSGMSMFILGGNRYTVVAKLGRYKGETTVTLNENDDTYVILYLTDFSLISTEIIVLMAFILFLTVIVYRFLINWKQNQ